MSMNISKILVLLSASLPLLFSGCGNHEPEPSGSVNRKLPVVLVDSIVAVRTVVEKGDAEVLLVPKSAIFRKGELAGVFVVGADSRLSLRWISTGRSMNGDMVVLGGLDKGEFVVGSSATALNDDITVKSQHVTEEVQPNE